MKTIIAIIVVCIPLGYFAGQALSAINISPFDRMCMVEGGEVREDGVCISRD